MSNRQTVSEQKQQTGNKSQSNLSRRRLQNLSLRLIGQLQTVAFQDGPEINSHTQL